MSGFYRLEFKVVSRKAVRPNGSIGTNVSLNAAAYIMAENLEQNISSVSAASYISGSKIKDVSGSNPDYTNKKGVLASWITLPEYAPEKYKDPEILWNAVEKVETAKNADLYLELIGCFEKHLTKEQKFKVAEEFSNVLAKEGLAVHIAIHEGKNNNDNDHFHILMPTRGFTENGEFDKTKTKPRGYAFDENGNKIPVLDKNGYQKLDQYNRPIYKRTPTEFVRHWNDPKCNNVDRWRHIFADIQNQYLPEEFKVCADSYEKQGIDRIPGRHLGKAASQVQARLEKQVNSLPPDQKEQYLLQILDDIQKQYRSVYYQSSRQLRNQVRSSLQNGYPYKPSMQYISYSSVRNRNRNDLLKGFSNLYYFALSQAQTPDEIEAEKAQKRILKAASDLIIMFAYGLTKAMENRLLTGEYELKKYYLKQLGKEIRTIESQLKSEGCEKDYDKLSHQLRKCNDRLTHFQSHIRKPGTETTTAGAANTISRISEELAKSQSRLEQALSISAETDRIINKGHYIKRHKRLVK